MSKRFDSAEWNGFCAAILRKDLRAGISEKTLNKICKGTKWEVPVFSCQLATSCEDRPEMRGLKRLEPKLDGCLSADWVIEFDDGTKVSIKDAVEKQIKGKVKSFNTITGKVEFNNVIGWSKDGHDDAIDSYEWVELELESGKILPPLTGNHLVYLPILKCYRRVDQLGEGDIILEDVLMKKTKITKIKKMANVSLVRYDLQVENTENFFANGVLVHNCRVLMVCTASDAGPSVISYSRNGKIFENFTTIEQQLIGVMDRLSVRLGHTSFVLDGEVVGNSFQELMRQARRKENVSADDSVFHVFDIIPLPDFLRGHWNARLQSRLDVLNKASNLISSLPNVELLPHINVDLNTAQGKDQFDRYCKDKVAEGFEGVMIKDLDAPYQCKRTTFWLKYKPVITVDLEVVDVEEGTGRNLGRLGALVCAGFDHGKQITVNVGSGFTDADRDSFWVDRNLVMGRTVEILCDTITKNQDGTYSLRFPRFLRFRSDLD
jgi:hypothetical protein